MKKILDLVRKIAASDKQSPLEALFLSLFLATRVRWVGRTAPTPPRKKIFVSGYYYSGSGACLDFLADHEGILKWPETVEVRFVNLIWGLCHLETFVATQGRLRAAHLARIYLHFIGRIPGAATRSPNSAQMIRVVNRTSREILASDYGPNHLRAATGLLRTLLPHIGRPVPRLRQILGDFFDDYNNGLLAQSGRRIVAYDRAVPPQELARLPVVGAPPHYVAVHRDPRAQFADICRARQDRAQAPMSVQAFIKMYRSRRERARTYVTENPAQFGAPMLLVSFEDLVSKPETRHALRQHLEIADLPCAPQHLIVEKSQANIALHERLGDTDSVKLIEQELADYLWPHGSLSGSWRLEKGRLVQLFGEGF